MNRMGTPVTGAVDATSVHEQLRALDAADPGYATEFVDRLLDAACRVRASDVHLQPTGNQLEIRWRMDGVLQRVGTFEKGDAADVVTRLKVLAQLLTYQAETPQEGRLTFPGHELEMRVSTFPTIFGERAVIRLFAAAEQLKHLGELGLSDSLQQQVAESLAETTGAILITGPAGSGKTTTAYACLRSLTGSTEGRNIVSLEDPVEVALPGVAQSQVNTAVGFDVQTGLRSMLRQDPEVLFVGEVRDRETAELAFQAALTGQLMLTTFHAGNAAEAVSRLVDMGIEPYLLRSGVLAIVHQRLVRKLCDCSIPSTDEADQLGLPVASSRLPGRCDECQGTGYRGRMLLAELLRPRALPQGRDLLSRDDTQQIEQAAVRAGMMTRWDVALEYVKQGTTSCAEVRRVLGFGQPVTSNME